MKKKHSIAYALSSGILLAPAWYEWGSGIFLLVAFIPLLFLEDYYFRNRDQHRPHKVFLYAVLAFFTWNLLSTWWLWNATIAGMFLAMIINTLLMSFIFWLFHITRRNAGNGPGYFGLIVYWIFYEHFYLNGEITWPWLNLGNGFANDIILVQWYEYTGSFGGSLWVLLLNITGFLLLKQLITIRNFRGKKGLLISYCLILFLPIIVSVIIYKTYRETEDPREIVILQPNIDPYNEKFGGLDPGIQLNMLLKQADSLTTLNTDYIVAPETFLNDNLWESELQHHPAVKRIRAFLSNYPRAKMVIGLTLFKAYKDPADFTATCQEIGNSGIFYDTYNAAMQLDSSGDIQIYRKSMLVVGVEKMPYPQYFNFLRKLTLRLGGTFRSHGTQEQRSNFYDPSDSTGISPIICWESVFGEYVTDYLDSGSDFLFVITNDGWWGDTPGYRQHHSYSRLRAIETRRSVARSANTGRSSFINQKGEVLIQTGYWVTAVIRASLNANRRMTFYALHGDFIARISYFFALLTLLYTLSNILIFRKK